MKAIKEKMATIGRSNNNSSSNSASGSVTNTRPPLPTKGSKRQPPPPQQQPQEKEKEKEKAASPPPAPSPKEEEEEKALTVEVPPENGGGAAEGGSSSSSSSESSYFIFSPTPPVTDGVGAVQAQGGPGSRLAGLVFGDEDGGKGGAAATGVSTAQASLGIAERIAGFLSLRDLGAYFGLDELGSKSFSAVRTGVDRLLGPLSLLRLVECALAAAQYTGKATAVVTVTMVEFARGGVAGIVRQVFAAVDALARLALAAVRELRRLSLRDLLRTLLLFLSERLDTGGHGRESDEAGVSSSKGPLLGSMGSSLKTALFHSFKDLDEISAENGSDRVAGAAAASLLLLGGGGEMGSGDWGFIPQRNAGLGRPSTKMGLVVAYREKNENVTHVTKQKVRRMMHYRVPLKPFEATIVCARPREQQALEEEEAAGATTAGMHAGAGGGGGKGMGAGNGEGDQGDGVVFPSVMCTPQSFPPTPISRACVMARFSQFSDDVVYLARDQLRLEELVKAEDDVTKMAAESLKQQACLAVFNSEDTANGIVLSCGGHCATKVGTTTLYTSTRAMVPIMRNRHVFFQMSIMAEETAAVASLCAGLSTPEMPLNTLVGSWKYSIGLCSTGQILVGSRWLTSSSTKQSQRFGCGCTVGVLVHIDECRVSDSWDGELVEAFIKFSVNGVPVILEGQPGGGEVTPLFIPKDDDVYPTLTLHSPSTQVLGRFCSADILHPHRALIGAPPGVPVYALDGSVILKPDQELGSTTL